MNILEQILADKHIEVEANRQRQPLDALQDRARAVAPPPVFI